MASSDLLRKTIKMIELLSQKERKQLLEWFLEEKQNQELSQFSYLTSHSVIEKEWLNPEEDKAWENL